MTVSQTPPLGASPSPTRWRPPRLSLLSREVAGITLLTFLVVATTSLFHVAHLRQAMVGDVLHEATLITKQVYAQSALALTQHPTDDPLRTLRADSNLRRLMDASVGHSPNLLYVMIADDANRTVVHSDRKREETSPRPVRASRRSWPSTRSAARSSCIRVATRSTT